jgi:hypothetical protein
LARHAYGAGQWRAACHGPRLIVAPHLAEVWTQAIEDARVSLRERANLDRCAEVRLEPDQNSLRVQVSLEDGRSATRQVASTAALLPTLEGLLELPAPELRPEDVWQEPVTVRDEVAPPGPALRATPAPHLEAGLGVMGRVSGNPLYDGVGIAAFAQLSLSHWLFGVVARWDAVDSLLADAEPSGFNMQTLAIGIDAGARTHLRGFLLDALIGPQIRVENQEAFGGQSSPDGVGGGTSDVRLDFSLRLSGPPDSRLRFFGEGDLDASPSRLSKTHRLDPQLPALPSWSAGITLGAAWSLP